MAIRMEDKSLRKSHRITLPARVNIGGELYAVLDWSLEGFRAEVPDEVLPEDWSGQVTFILPLQSMNVSFDAVARLRRRNGDGAGFSFDSLPARSKALLSTYIKASIEGQLDDIDGMIARVEASVSEVRTDRPLTLGEHRQFRRRFLGRTLLSVLLILLALCVVAFILFTNISRARSTRAVVSGGLIDVAAEIPGVLTRRAVAEGDTVAPGDLLFTLDDADLVREAEDIRHRIAIDKEELDYLYVLLQEESKSVGLYRKAARHEVESLVSQLAGVDARMAVARKEFDRAQELLRVGVISQSLWDERRKELLDLEARKAEIGSRLRLAEENVASARDGKYLSDGQTRGEIRELEARVRVQEAVLAQRRFQLSQALAGLEKSNVLSRTGGVVYAVKRDPGTYLRAGESVMTLFVPEAAPWVLARFTFEEAERFAPGAEAAVYIPSLNAACTGRVQALGHHAMGTGPASLDMEISLSEMPVKISLIDPPAGLYPGMGAVVGIETPWLRAVRAMF
jgi:multidrug resistance efflux pump